MWGRRATLVTCLLAISAWIQRAYFLKRLEDASHTAVSNGPSFLVGVFSTSEEVAARARLRKDVFDHGRRVCSLQNFIRSPFEAHDCIVLYTFVLGGNSDGPSVLTKSRDPSSFLTRTGFLDEMDVTVLDIQENMQDGKTLTWFAYANTFVHQFGVEFVGKMDSDTYMNMDLFVDFVHRELVRSETERAHRKIYGGVLTDAIACGVLAGNEACKLLRGRVYMSGQFYFVSADMLEHVVKYGAANFEHRIGIEDMDFGVWVQSHPESIYLLVMTGELLWLHSPQTKLVSGWIDSKNELLHLPKRHDNLKILDACLQHGKVTCLQGDL